MSRVNELVKFAFSNITNYETEKGETGFKVDMPFLTKTEGLMNKGWFVIPNDDRTNANSPYFIADRYMKAVKKDKPTWCSPMNMKSGKDRLILSVRNYADGTSK